MLRFAFATFRWRRFRFDPDGFDPGRTTNPSPPFAALLFHRIVFFETPGRVESIDTVVTCLVRVIVVV